MTNIEIDFEVYQQLTLQRHSENDSYNNVIRRLLSLPTNSENGHKVGKSTVEWVSKGYRYPEGTEFKAVFNGKEYFAKIDDGKLVYDDDEYKSFSGAAKAVTGGQRNGWDFWQQRQPGGRWRKLY